MCGISYTVLLPHLWLNCSLITHNQCTSAAACPSVTPDCLAEADGAPHTRRSRSRRQPEPLHKMKWPHGVTGRKRLPEELRSGVSSSLPGSAHPSAPARWHSGAQQRHFFLRGWYGGKQTVAASFPCWFHFFRVALCLLVFIHYGERKYSRSSEQFWHWRAK